MKSKSKGTPSDKKARPSLLRRLLAFLLTLALVLGAVALVVFRDALNYDAIKRYFSYRSLERSDSGQTQTFLHNSGTQAHFSGLDGDLFLCSGSGISIFSSGGIHYLTDPVVFETPITHAGTTHAVAYDVGGLTLRAYTDRNPIFSLDVEEGHEILSARMNDRGQLTVTAREPGYKGAVTVYDPQFEPQISLRLSSQFVMDGLMADDGRTIGVLTAGQTNNSFESNLALYNLNDDTPFASCSLGNGLILDLAWGDDVFWSLGETRLTTVNAKGELVGQYDYRDQYLKAFSLDGDGFATLLLGQYRAGSNATLVTVDATGDVIASLDLTEQVLSLDSNGRYVAMLTASGLHIYTKDLEPYSSLEATSGIREVVLLEDGTAYLIGNEEAQLFIPE